MGAEVSSRVTWAVNILLFYCTGSFVFTEFVQRIFKCSDAQKTKSYSRNELNISIYGTRFHIIIYKELQTFKGPHFWPILYM